MGLTVGGGDVSTMMLALWGHQFRVPFRILDAIYENENSSNITDLLYVDSCMAFTQHVWRWHTTPIKTRNIIINQ